MHAACPLAEQVALAREQRAQQALRNKMAGERRRHVFVVAGG